jgi:tRNA (guanine-N7-)-methyltransferase
LRPSQRPSDQSGRTGGFHGRRKGHPLGPNRTRLLASLLPRLALDLERSAPADLRTLFPAALAGVRLEIGFGGGEHFVTEAGAHPSCGFIGCEPFVNGMARALAAIEAAALTNVRLHHAEAAPLLAWLPADSISGVDLLYPDPWPKKRHWKRRFVQDESVAALARIMTPGALFRFASDIPDYAAWTLERLRRCPAFEWTAEGATDWRQPWAGYAPTRYESKARSEGRVPCYLVFRRR